MTIKILILLLYVFLHIENELSCFITSVHKPIVAAAEQTFAAKPWHLKKKKQFLHHLIVLSDIQNGGLSFFFFVFGRYLHSHKYTIEKGKIHTSVSLVAHSLAFAYLAVDQFLPPVNLNNEIKPVLVMNI